MKKIFTTGLIAAVISAFGQQNVSTNSLFPKNEIKVNALYPFFGAVELSYERHLSPHSSMGISSAARVGSLDLSLGFTPYYRYYFGRKPNSGFFLEGNSALVWSKKGTVYDSSYSNGVEKKSFGFGLGGAVGYKYEMKNNFLIEAYGGGGVFLNNDLSDGGYPRFGVSVGKRF